MRKSWVTQRVANRIPPWTDGRLLPYSNLQQIINPMATAIEDLYKYIADGNRNKFLSTANLDILDTVSMVQLPNDFQLGRHKNNLQNTTYVAPLVKTIIDGLDIWVEATTTIDDFWYNSIPTRAVHGTNQKQVPVQPILEETILDNLLNATLNSIAHPTRLVLTIANCQTFVDLSRRTEYSFIMLTGQTERGLVENELMIIPYNGVFLTKKIWQTLTKIEYYGLQPSATGTLAIDCFAFNKGREVDKYQIFVTPFTEKLLYHKLGVNDFPEGLYAVHQFMTVTANTLGNLYQGFDTLEVTKEVELLYNNENLTLIDMAIQPFTGRIFALASDAIYIFDQYANLPNYQGLGVKTSGASMVISTDQYDFIRGNSVILKPNWRKPSKRIYRNRWSVKKPDETIAYINIDSTELSDANAAWITNQTYTELVFGPFHSNNGEIDKQNINYVLTQRGTYIFTLETQYVDKVVEKDIIPIHVHSKEAIQKLRLPAQLQHGDGIAFDADQKLWILRRAGEGAEYDLPYAYGQQYNLTGCAYEVYLPVDNMLVDFENKTIYLHEPYDSVEVTESEDWMVEQ